MVFDQEVLQYEVILSEQEARSIFNRALKLKATSVDLSKLTNSLTFFDDVEK